MRLFLVRPARLCGPLALLCCLAAPLPAQFIRTNTVTTTVEGAGSILSVSPLATGDREKAGDIYVLGNVSVMFIGPWHLQVKLSTPFVDKNGNGTVKATNEVRALLPNNTYATLGTTNWVTIASGTGTMQTTKPVKYFIVWGKSSAKNPALAVTIPVEYRVIPN